MSVDGLLEEIAQAGLFANLIQLDRDLWSANVRKYKEQTTTYHRAKSAESALRVAFAHPDMTNPAALMKKAKRKSTKAKGRAPRVKAAKPIKRVRMK